MVKAGASRWANLSFTVMGNLLALMGALFVAAVVTLFVRPDLLRAAEDYFYLALVGKPPPVSPVFVNTAQNTSVADLASLILLCQ